MATIKNGKVGFSATWEGKSDKKDGVLVFKLALSASEIAASMYLWSLYGKPLEMNIFLDKNKKISVGRCSFEKLVGGREGDSTLQFLSSLLEWQVSPEDQILFKERLLAVIVVDKDETENENEEEENG